jgi:hypothetical protein
MNVIELQKKIDSLNTSKGQTINFKETLYLMDNLQEMAATQNFVNAFCHSISYAFIFNNGSREVIQSMVESFLSSSLDFYEEEYKKFKRQKKLERKDNENSSRNDL